MNEIKFAEFITVCSTLSNSPTDEILADENGKLFCFDSNSANTFENIKELRKRTWTIFQSAIKRELSEPRLEYICQRYFCSPKKRPEEQKSFTLDEMHDIPLLHDYIIRFGVGWANLSTYDLKEFLQPQTKLKTILPSELEVLIRYADPWHYLGSKLSPQELRAGPSELSHYIIFDHLSQDRKRLFLYEGMKSLTKNRHGWLQRLGMAIIGHEMDLKTLVPAIERDGVQEYYKLYRTIAGKGAYIDVFIPVWEHSNLPSLLVIRPTQSSLSATDGPDTWLGNMQENNGEDAYLAIKQKLKELIDDPKFCGPNSERKFNISSYSWGGTIGGYVYRDFAHKIDEAVFFNTVQNSDPKVAEEAAKNVNALDPNKSGPSIYIYRNVTSEDGKKGDWATFLGSKHVGWGIRHPKTYVQVMDILIPKETPKDMSTWLDVHGYRALDDKIPVSKKFPIKVYVGESVDAQLHNAKRDREIFIFEEMRQKFGVKFLYHIINFFYKFLQFIFRVFGIEIFRSSSH